MNLKKITILAFSSLYCLTAASAQTKSTNSSKVDVQIHQQVFNNAVALRDATSALQACHYIVAIQGSNSPYKDSMAMLYHNLGSYRQALQLSTSLLKQKPENTSLLGIAADSYNKIGNLKEAINYQEQLYKLKPNVVNGFKLLEMQVQIQRNAEAIVTANQLLSSKIDSNLVYYYKDTTGNQVQTPIKAAIYNYLGNSYFKLADKAKAKAMLRAALKEDEKFYIARMNYEAVLKDEEKK